MADDYKPIPEHLVLDRTGKIGSDKWEYEFYHYNPEWRGIQKTDFAYAEKMDNHYVLVYGETNFQGSHRKNFGVEDANETGIANADRRIREAVLEARKYCPENLPLEESVYEDHVFP